MISTPSDGDHKAETKNGSSRRRNLRDEESETDDQDENGPDARLNAGEDHHHAGLKSSPETENGELRFSKRGRRLRRISLNEEELFDNDFGEEDEGFVPLKRVRRSSSQASRSSRGSRGSRGSKYDDFDHTGPTRPQKAPVYTRSGRLARQNSRFDTESNDDEVLDQDRDRHAAVPDEDEEDVVVRRSTRLQRGDRRSVYRDPSDDETEDMTTRKRIPLGRGESIAKEEPHLRLQIGPDAGPDDSSEDKSNMRRSHRVRSNVARYSPIKDEESSPLKTPPRGNRLRRVLNREQRAMRRRSRSRGSKSQDKDSGSKEVKRSLRPRSGKRPSLREVPNNQIELRRRSRDSSDDAFSSPSSDEEESEVMVHISEDEKYDLAQTAKEVKDLPPRERASRSVAQVPANIADLGREARRGSRPYRPRLREVFLDQVKTGGEPKKAAIEPIKVDPSITWDTVGGLDAHIKALKEMVILPLLYPEIFEKFKMEPPKGVLFYGPPGTGKTLCARALAASCGVTQTEDKAGNTTVTSRVSFFMRNGADCLSKWVGEAERTLRQMFEVAKQQQPSIIFFDEIDGLAPVRSSRQDQIHSSIVSTLLGLMDGLEARGQIIVIGATNRIDSIDPALRRPGRFDREMIFKLPNHTARKKILGIHTRHWKPPPNELLLEDIASRTVGYCGADLKSLCTESALHALRRRYPQIYESTDKLLIDPGEVNVGRVDYFTAMKSIIPASHRSTLLHSRPLDARVSPLLSPAMTTVTNILQKIFRQGISATSKDKKDMADNDSNPDDFMDEPIVNGEQNQMEALEKIARAMQPPAHRPRLAICGETGQGQEHLGPALLHFLEGCPVFGIDLVSLHADPSAKSQEEALVSAFREAGRAAPSVLYLPHMDVWWETASESLRATLILALRDMPTLLPVLVLATAQETVRELPAELKSLFGNTFVSLSSPDSSLRRKLLEPLFGDVAMPARIPLPQERARRRARKTEVLEKAPPPPPKKVEESELVQKRQDEDRQLRNLRMEMRELLARLLNDRKYMIFWNPVDPEEATDYYDIIKEPIDLSMIAANVDAGRYATVLHMVSDLDLMVRNAIEYNPPYTEQGARILRRAHALIDLVHCWADNLDSELVKACNEVVARRAKEAADAAQLVKQDVSAGGEKATADPTAAAVGKTNDERGDPSLKPATEGANPLQSTDDRRHHSVPFCDGKETKKEVALADGKAHPKENMLVDHGRNEEATLLEAKAMDGGVNPSQSTMSSWADKPTQEDFCRSPHGDRQKEDKDAGPTRVAVAALCGENSDLAASLRLSNSLRLPAPGRVSSILTKAVQVSDGWNVDSLERLYVALAEMLYENRSNSNRDEVLTFMDKKLAEILVKR